jgi:hypothetical protein
MLLVGINADSVHETVDSLDTGEYSITLSEDPAEGVGWGTLETID